jgi:hypothetical protein
VRSDASKANTAPRVETVDSNPITASAQPMLTAVANRSEANIRKGLAG